MLKSPFPYFGGKSRVAEAVWQRFGDVPNYVEPFFGSGAVLLSRPHEPHVETVNDIDGLLTNCWRAIQHDPDGVAQWANWPVSELDLHARHNWLITQGAALIEPMRNDPDLYDVKVAGWWLWGICQWIGSGWCKEIRRKCPHIGNAGMGINRTSHQLPHIGSAGRGEALREYITALSQRMERVRVCCGDWKRVLGPSPTTKIGTTAVFLDPPYSHDVRSSDIYAHDNDVSQGVREWAIANGDNPMLRIALCGYDNEHGGTMPEEWGCCAWKAKGGYASQGDGSNDNAVRERIWFSPHCLGRQRAQVSLFEMTGVSE